MKKISDIVKCKVVSMTDRADTRIPSCTLKRIYSRETGDECLMGEGDSPLMVDGLVTETLCNDPNGQANSMPLSTKNQDQTYMYGSNCIIKIITNDITSTPTLEAMQLLNRPQCIALGGD